MNHARQILRALLLIFGLILTADLIHPARAQVPPPNPAPAPIYLGPNSLAEFDVSGLDVDGEAETFKDCEFGLASPLIVDLNAQPNGGELITSLTAPTTVGLNTVALRPILETYGQGQYRFWVRVRDKAGNASQWAGGMQVAIDTKPPAVPVNIRFSFQLSGTVTIQPGNP